MTWIKENQFWAGSIGVAALIVLAFAYVYLASPVSRLASDVQNKMGSLETRLERTGDPKKKGGIPPRKSKQVIDGMEESYRKELRNLGTYYLKATRDLERWFDGEPDPSAGLFQSKYTGARKRLLGEIRRQNVKLGKGGGDTLFGTGGGQSVIDWSEKPAENMSRTQKEFWIVRRIVQDAIHTGVDTITKIRFRDNAPPVKISGMGGRELARRIRVRCSFVLQARRIGALLSRFMTTEPEEEETMSLQMYIPSYTVSKLKTSTGALGPNDGTWAQIETVKGEQWENWTPGGIEQLPVEYQTPFPVQIQLTLIVMDVHEPTIVRIMKKAGLKRKEIQKRIKASIPFYTERQIQELLGG